MKKLVLLLCCGLSMYGRAQNTDTVSRLAAAYFKEAEVAAKDQHIWKLPLYGPSMFVDPVSRLTYANMPDSAGILKPEDGIYKGILPKEVMIANTSINWEGKEWSVILWPLPSDRNERVNLVLHESFHRIQQQMGFPQRGSTVDHLSSMYGRIYFLLELKALEAALKKPVDQRAADLTNALIFRDQRKLLFPQTFGMERLLEMSEGLAEYTGVILGRQPDDVRPHLYRQIDTAGERKSFIRSSAYLTGPVYGLLLYEKSPDWTMRADSNSDFPALIKNYYHLGVTRQAASRELSSLEKKYNGDVIIASEKSKEDRRLQTARAYTDLFTKRPVLTIKLLKMGINFNPNNLFDLGELGTVYPTVEIRDTWGHLTVSSGGMLMKDWRVVTLPINDTINLTEGSIACKGWTLVLASGWKLVKINATLYKISQ